jgi:hypothetical protein
LQETGNLVDLTNANNGANYFLGSPWMSGFGPASDAQGYIYFATGNGPFDGKSDFSQSIMKVPGNLNLAGASFFTPIQADADSEGDNDLGSGGVMLLPDQSGSLPHLLVAGGECSSNNLGCFKYVLNRHDQPVRLRRAQPGHDPLQRAGRELDPCLRNGLDGRRAHLAVGRQRSRVRSNRRFGGRVGLLP